MKVFKSILAVTLVLAFTVPAFAGGNDKTGPGTVPEGWWHLGR
jgi:hypothetical protein